MIHSPAVEMRSLAQAIFEAERILFLCSLERFLRSPATPAHARAEEARATLSAITQIIELSRGNP